MWLKICRLRVKEAIDSTDTKRIPLSFDYCISAQLRSDQVEKIENTGSEELSVDDDAVI